LWHKTNLFNQGSYVINRIVAGRIQFMYVQGCAFIKTFAGITGITSFPSACRFSQLIVLARMRAQVVLPTPRGPQNKNAWPTGYFYGIL
jgi:hypothetical protein